MNCKKCSLSIEKEAKFCPYCGSTQSITDKDPFKDMRVNFDQPIKKQSIIYKEDLQTTKSTHEENYQNNISLIGLILAIISIPLLIMKLYIGTPVAIISLILVIIGYKKAKRSLAITSLTISIITLILNIVITIFILLLSITIKFSNGHEVSVKNYLVDAFFNGYYSDEVNGSWVSASDELIQLNGDGTYYIYEDEFLDEYYYGEFTSDTGFLIGNDIFYADDNYYYYKIDTFNNMAKIEGEIYDETIDLLQNGFIIKLNKKNRDHIKIVNDITNTDIDFKRK